MSITLAGRDLPLPDPLMRCPNCHDHMLWWTGHAWRCMARLSVEDEDGRRSTTLVHGCGRGLGISHVLRGIVIGAEQGRAVIDPSAATWLEAGVPLAEMLVSSDALSDAIAGRLTLPWIPAGDLPRLLAEAQWLDRQDDSLDAYVELLAGRAGSSGQAD